MKLLIHLVLWMGWLLMAYFVGSCFLMIRSGVESKPADEVLRTVFIITSVVAFLFGFAAIHLRKHLFWIRRNVTIEDGSGRAIFLGFSMAAITGGAMATLALFVPGVMWGETKLPMVSIGVGIAYLVLLFPRLPGTEEQ